MCIEATGLPLGLFDDADYDEFRFKMKPGDMFVFFSDGILDARNRRESFLAGDGWRKSSRNAADARRTVWWSTLFKAVPSILRESKRSTTRPSWRSKSRIVRLPSPQNENDAAQRTYGTLQASSSGRPDSFYASIAKDLLRRRRSSCCIAKDIPLAKLAERYGTPLYVYSATAIRTRLAAFRECVSTMFRTPSAIPLKQIPI